MERERTTHRIEILGIPGAKPFAGLGVRPIRVGSSSECEVRLPAKNEAVFAMILRMADRWYLAEALSEAGAELNGARIFQSPLSDGDRLRILGVQLEIRLPNEPSSAPIASASTDLELDRTVKRHPGLAKIGVTLTKTLHRGASGVFFKANWDRRPSCPVIVKMIASHLVGDEDAMFRFCRGVTAAGDLRSPHLLRLFRAGKIGDGWYLINEYANRGSLRDLLTAPAKEPSHRGRARLAAKVGIEIGRALEVIAQAGLMHRGVTPSAVLFDEQGIAKLGDFTLARGEDLATFRRFTMAGDAVGGHAYMSPEQALGSTNVDVRTDVYSLGAVMYFAAAGKPPLEGGSLVELIDAICRRKPVPPSAVNAKVPPALDEAILKALAKNPAERFRSPMELRSAVETLGFE